MGELVLRMLLASNLNHQDEADELWRAMKMPVEDVLAGCLWALIHHSGETGLARTCQAIDFLSRNRDSERLQVVINSGVVPRLVELTRHPSTAVLAPALVCICDLVLGTDSQIQYVIDQGALPAISSILNGVYSWNIKQYACWAISNISADHDHDIKEALINSGIVSALIPLLRHATSDFVEVEVAASDALLCAVRSVFNISLGGTRDQIKYLVQVGYINPLCRLLQFHQEFPFMVKMCLEIIRDILDVGESDKNEHGSGFNQYALMMPMEKIDDLRNRDRIASLATEIYIRYAEPLLF